MVISLLAHVTMVALSLPNLTHLGQPNLAHRLAGKVGTTTDWELFTLGLTGLSACIIEHIDNNRFHTRFSLLLPRPDWTSSWPPELPSSLHPLPHCLHLFGLL